MLLQPVLFYPFVNLGFVLHMMFLARALCQSKWTHWSDDSKERKIRFQTMVTSLVCNEYFTVTEFPDLQILRRYNDSNHSFRICFYLVSSSYSLGGAFNFYSELYSFVF